MKILILGPPGSGKSLLSNLLVEKYNLKRISVGKILREIAKKHTKLGKKINDIIDSGKLAPTKLTDEIVERQIKKANGDNFIMDGFPRGLSQAKFLDKIIKIDYIFLLDIPEKIIIERLSKRLQCINGHIFHLINIPPKKPGICDFCHRPLSQRDDDEPEAIKARLKVYKKQTLPVIKYYQNRIIKINADRKYKEILKSITNYIKKNPLSSK